MSGSPAATTSCATFVEAPIALNEAIAQDTYRLRFEAPQIAATIRPGQFLMLRLAGVNDPLLGRPLALFDISRDGAGRPSGVEVVYLRAGKLTTQLARRKPGDLLEVWGPLGNGFDLPAGDLLLMVAGGVGVTPFLALAKEAFGQEQYGPPGRTTERYSRAVFCYGVRTRAMLAGPEAFRATGLDLKIASDDGSVGHHGYVTELLAAELSGAGSETPVVATCGPEPMMRSVAGLAAAAGVRCFASLETPMACGIGACFSCVAPIKQPEGGWDYKRTCLEGPVFDASTIQW